MPTTARKHFDEDIARARDLWDLGKNRLPGPEKMLRADLYRSSWMYAVGAMDAYFCDAYVDLLARLLRAKSMEPHVKVVVLDKVKIPIGLVLAKYAVRDNAKWRMAARELMANQNILRFDDVKTYLNDMVQGDKLLQNGLIDDWVDTIGCARWLGTHREGILTANRAKGPKSPNSDYDKVRTTFNARFKALCQRRHDCIHNCDRPDVKPKVMESGTAKNAISDIEWLVHRIDAWADAGFRSLVTHLKFGAVTRNQVGC